MPSSCLPKIPERRARPGIQLPRHLVGKGMNDERWASKMRNNENSDGTSDLSRYISLFSFAFARPSCSLFRKVVSLVCFVFRFFFFLVIDAASTVLSRPAGAFRFRRISFNDAKPRVSSRRSNAYFTVPRPSCLCRRQQRTLASSSVYSRTSKCNGRTARKLTEQHLRAHAPQSVIARTPAEEPNQRRH